VVSVVSGGAGAVLMGTVNQDAGGQSQGAPITVTAPIEEGVLTQAVTVRGEAGYANVTNVEYRGGAGTVAGLWVARGDRVDGGALLLDVSGRPIIALQGAVPMYRDITLGDSGDDVWQLTTALVGLDLLPEADATYTAAAAEALSALYDGLGYPAPSATAQAREEVTAAGGAVDQAESDLNAATASITRSTVLAAELNVEQARTALAAEPRSREAKLALDLALEQLNEARNPPSVGAAESALEAARTRLARAQADAAPVAEMGEIAFVSTLPATVTGDVPVVGDPADGVLLEISSGQLGVELSVTPAQRALISEGDEVTVESDDGVTQAVGRVAAVGTQLETAAGGAQAFIADVTLEGGDVSLAGQSVKATVTVSESDGPVLYVPKAAVLTDVEGRSYVELWLGDANSGHAERTNVMTGLITSSSVEIKSDALRAGDRVVVDETVG
jgi:hypothetical protein